MALVTGLQSGLSSGLLVGLNPSAAAAALPVPSILTENASTTDAASVSTGSISPIADQPLYAYVAHVRGAGTIATPTCSGNGLTWTQVATVTHASATIRRITVFEASSAAPTAGAVTFDFGGQTQDSFVWGVIQFADAATAAFTVQSKTAATNSVTSLTATLDVAAAASSAVLAFAMTRDTPAQVITVDPQFTELAERAVATNPARVESSWARGETSCTPSWAAADNGAVIIVEVKAA